MVKFTKIGLDITEYKPKMNPVYVKDVADLRAIPCKYGETTVQVKGDGEFNLVSLSRKCAFAINRFGRRTDDLPALEEIHQKYLGVSIEGCPPIDVLAEMYAVDTDGKPLPLPKFIHYLKGGEEALHKQIHLGLFGIPSIVSSIKTFKMLETCFNGKLCHVLPYIIPKNKEEIDNFWVNKVEKEGWEGLVIRNNGDTYKAKPNRDIDAVIIGINKTKAYYEKKLAKSVKVALMNEDGDFVELGDATVTSEEEARELFSLTHVKESEDDSTVWVKPVVIVTIDFISLFPDTKNNIHSGRKISRVVGVTKLVRMKSPRVKKYRVDKKVCIQDIGLNQVSE